MTYRCCGALEQQFHAHGATDDVGGAHNNRMLAFIGGSNGVQKSDDTCRCARAQGRLALHQAADVVGVKAVYIFVGAYLYQNRVRVQV